MRTARTIAQTRKGKEVVLSDRFVPVHQQVEGLRKWRVLKSHPDYESVSYQESDGEEVLIRFSTPTEQKKFEETRAKEHQQYLAALEADKTDARKAQGKAQGKPAEELPAKAAVPDDDGKKEANPS